MQPEDAGIANRRAWHAVANQLALARLLADKLVAIPDLPEAIAEDLRTLADAVAEAGDLLVDVSSTPRRDTPGSGPVRPSLVLLVEDDPDLRDLVAEALSADAHYVVAVGDAESADRVLRDRRIQLLVTDLQLPAGSGFDLAARAVALGVRVLVISGNSGPNGSLPLGVSVLEKPFGVPELRAHVRHALGA